MERDRILTDDEIVKFWKSCDVVGWPYGGLFQLLLLTGARRDEVGQREWSELDLDKRLWTLPGIRSKNGRLHEIHLSETALEILKSVPVINNSRFVFTASGNSPVGGWSAAKTAVDKLMIDVPPWRLHDLRRTCASGMARIGIPPHVVDRVLNHSTGTISGIARIHNRFEYGPERKAALNAWSQYVNGLMNPTPTNVVKIRSRI